MSQPAFNGLAQDYAHFRPSYPLSIYEPLLRRLAGRSGLRVLDAGCGTGINAVILQRLLAEQGIARITGVDISDDMLAQARSALPDAEFLQGGAEHMPLPDASQDLVVASQAVQWFDRLAFYLESRRLLVDRGLIAILENNRDWRHSAFLDAYESFLEAHSVKDDGSHYSRFYRDFPYEEELAAQFDAVQCVHERWSRTLSTQEFIGMVRSSTQAQRVVKRRGLAFLEDSVGTLIATHFPQGTVDVPYDTVIYVAEKSGA
jgi:ubiquinone/menaquinone biosynthesis C-methylase UbiE